MDYITRKQQKLAHALMRDIGQHIGYFSEAVSSEMLKKHFEDAMDYDRPFSLKKTVCTYREYVAFHDFLVSVALDVGVDADYPLVVYQDIERYCAKCIELVQCCVTGAKENVEIHFVDKPVYNSYSSWEVNRYRRMALRSDLHKEIETIGLEAFLKKYPTCIPVKCYYNPDIKDKYLERD